MSGLFVREFEFPLDFSGKHHLCTYEVCHPQAKVDHVSIRKEYDEMGRLSREFGVLSVRDVGSPTRPTTQKKIVVVRRLNDLIPIPEEAGRLLGFLQSSGGRSQYYVFQGRVADQRIDNTDANTTSPPPARESATCVAASREEGCPCVFSGPKEHESAEEETPSSEEASHDWWSDPDEAQAS